MTTRRVIKCNGYVYDLLIFSPTISEYFQVRFQGNVIFSHEKFFDDPSPQYKYLSGLLTKQSDGILDSISHLADMKFEKVHFH